MRRAAVALAFLLPGCAYISGSCSYKIGAEMACELDGKLIVVSPRPTPLFTEAALPAVRVQAPASP